MVDSFGQALADTLAPRRCPWCGLRCPNAAACSGCLPELPWIHRACHLCALPLPEAATLRLCRACATRAPPQDHSFAPFHYTASIAHAIQQLKFHARLDWAPVLAGSMGRSLARRAEPLPRMLIPVPLHAARLRSRGYNQSVELGRALAGILSIELRTGAAWRIRPTTEQTALPAQQRRRNLAGAFKVSAAVRGSHVALLDDVMTTGATMAELAQAARRAGAARIEAWAVARA